MTPFDQVMNFLFSGLQNFTPLVLVQIIFLVGLLIYLAFAIIVVRQVMLMTRTLNTSFETPVKIVAWVHLGVVLVVFLLALVIL